MHEFIEYKGYKIEIVPDECPESPREWDNLGTMICFHKGYNLGDKHGYNISDYDSWDAEEEAITKEHNPVCILPLYLLDHSGLRMSVNSFRDPWDSGQVGFIYISREKWTEEFTNETPREHGYKMLIAEVDTYNQYLEGDVWGYKVVKGNQQVDSCWGFYGYDYCLVEAKSIVDFYADDDANLLQQKGFC